MRCSLSLLALAAAASAQSDVLSALTGDSELSMLAALGASLPMFASVVGMSNITILAPTNEAFMAVDNNTALGRAVASNDTAYLGATLAYHVLMGNYSAGNITTTPKFAHTLLNSSFEFQGQPLANVTNGQYVELLKNGDAVTILSGSLAEANVTQADIRAGGITIHKINRVLSIPDTVSNTALAAGENVAVAALILANLAQAVDTMGDVTIFVPSNEAFNSVGSALIAASPEELARVLEYHVVNGSVLFTTDAANTTVKSMEGKDLELSVVDDEVFVNEARVVVPNVIVRNGAVHLINAVLNPNSTSINRSSLSTTGTPTPAFSGATSTTFSQATQTATSTIIIPAIVTNAPQAASTSGASSSSSSSSKAAAAPLMTAAANLVGAAAFMAGAFIV